MAIAYLNENATSAAAANWSDSTGFADGAELVLSTSNGISVINDVDYSSLTTGVESFEIQETFNADAASAGQPFVFDADASSDAFVRHRGPRRFYYGAGGGSNNCNNYYQAGNGSTYLEGGTFDNMDVVRGEFYANESTVITNMTAWGGRGAIEYNATDITLYYQSRGQFLLKRGGEIIVGGGTLTLDIPDSSPSIDLTIRRGGRVIVLRADVIANCHNEGMLDMSRAKRPVTLGGTTHEQGPYAKLVRGSLNHAITEPLYLGGVYSVANPETGSI